MTSASRRSPWRLLLAIMAVLVLLGGVAVWTNVLGVGDEAMGVARRIELIVHPPPDRPIAAEVHVTPRPSGAPTPSLAPTPVASLAPGARTPASTPTPTPVPQRAKVDVNLYTDPAAHFVTEIDHEWCAVAGTQMVLAAHGKADLTAAFQRTLEFADRRVGEPP